MSQVHHVAIIMDGNGRWAKKRGLPRIIGHRQGVESVRAVVKASLDLGIDYLTLYTFSTENWQRPKREVDTLMKMLEEMLAKETPGLHKNNVRVKVIGRLDDVYPNARAVVNDTIALTKNNDGLILTFCISYGSRGEIVDAVKKIVVQDRKKHIALDRFDERTFTQFLYEPDLPDPDLLIRTGAEHRERISNFLLWQIAYTEIYFTKTLWPDFRRKEFTGAIDAFTRRERLFGRVK
jgi:undecaprenyl diphosphate synthase